MRHIISILLQNEAGALARVAGMFASRGYNIDALSVAPTHDPTVSRLTVVTTGSEEVVQQIVQQTRKLIDVVQIVNLSTREHLECEMLMLKFEVDPATVRTAIDCVRRYHGVILDESDNTRMVQLSGTGSEIDAFITEMGRTVRLLEMARSGVAAMERGQQVLVSPA
jgi:acetolactate synthase-1/3 small subunit